MTGLRFRRAEGAKKISGKAMTGQQIFGFEAIVVKKARQKLSVCSGNQETKLSLAKRGKG